MRRIATKQRINLPRMRHATCTVYEHEGKTYIRATRPGTSAYNPFFYEGKEYAEVVNLSAQWFTV